MRLTIDPDDVPLEVFSDVIAAISEAVTPHGYRTFFKDETGLRVGYIEPMIQKEFVSSEQWCTVHDIHQDDPAHTYDVDVCEGRLRDATPAEEQALLAQLGQVH